jgi:hypothetical protein
MGCPGIKLREIGGAKPTTNSLNYGTASLAEKCRCLRVGWNGSEHKNTGINLSHYNYDMSTLLLGEMHGVYINKNWAASLYLDIQGGPTHAHVAREYPCKLVLTSCTYCRLSPQNEKVKQA